MKDKLKKILGVFRPGSPGAKTALISSLGLLAVSAGLFVIYFFSKYLLFALTGAVFLAGTLPGIVLCFAKAGSDGKKPKHPAVISVICGVLFAGVQVLYYFLLKRMTSVYSINYLYAVILLVMFVLLVIIEKWCLHEASEDKRDSSLLKNMRAFSACGRLSIVLLLICSVIKLLGFFDLTKYTVIAVSVIFYYASLFILLSLASRVIRNELYSSPDISVPLPFSGSGDLRILSYLENSTGITMHGLWSIRLIKMMLPIMAVSVVLIIWLSTGFVQIESYEAGALYRFGVLQDEPLEPGLHYTLPVPFDKVVKYETDTVRKITIGYRSEESGNNTWTESHGTSEFKLLLGGGNELVSINLRIEYRINDLIKYVRCSSAPEKLLEASAYELITAQTISNDLATLLSIDREAFADSFAEDLKQAIDSFDPGNGSKGIGIEIVSVVLESIHPPVDVAEKYQELISAQIKAEKLQLEAEGYAARVIAEAEAKRDTAVNTANADGFTSIAAAESSVAEFMASVAADSEYGDSYRYYKYLNVLSSAYANANIILVGDGVDSSSIYFGGFPLQ